MKKSPLVGSAALITLSFASVVHAQEAPASGAFAFPAQDGARTRAGRAVALSGARPAWLEKLIDVNIKNERPADAAKRIVKQAGKKLENVEIGEGVSDVRLSLSVRGVKAGDALAAIGRIGGAIASVSERDEKVTVYLKKRNDRVATLSELPAMSSLFVGGADAAAFPKEQRIEIERAIADAGRAIDIARPKLDGIAKALPSMVSFPSAFAKLPNKRVSIDLKKVEVRDALKKILGDAGVAYALDDDLPTETKYSFTFEDVPLGTALDLICSSAGVGWRSEKTDEKGGALVKVGKKYRGNSRNGDLSFVFPGLDGKPLGGLDALPGEIRTILTEKG